MGNKIYANIKDDWERVSSIEVDGEKFKFERTKIKLNVDVQLSPDRSIDLLNDLPPIRKFTYESNLAACIRCDAARAVLTNAKYSRVEPYTQRATRGTESDSGDEGPEDDEIPSVFTAEELTFFHRDLKNLHNRYHQAKFVNFQNAYGKFFYQELCRFLLPDTMFDCLISTNPKGNFQPGAMSIEWVTPGRKTRGSASCSIVPMVLQCQERVADFVVVNKNIYIYNIVGDVKPDVGGLNQNMEQMVGLLGKGQKVMLGLVANPEYVSPRVLRCSGDTFYFEHLDDLQLSNPNHLHKLAKLIVLFNSFESP